MSEELIWATKGPKWTFNSNELKAMNDGKQMGTVWDIPMTPLREKKFGKHPAQKPEALLHRIILGWSNPGDLVVDPFAGAGTTGVVALRNGRRTIVIDQEQEYVEIMQRRIAAELEARG